MEKYLWLLPFFGFGLTIAALVWLVGWAVAITAILGLSAFGFVLFGLIAFNEYLRK